MKKLKDLQFTKLLRGLILFVVSIVLAIICGVISMIYNLIHYSIKLSPQIALNTLGEYLHRIALSIDQLGNVLGATIFGKLFTKDDVYPFGHEDQTISYVLAINEKHGKLTFIGRLIVFLLELIDTGHMKKSITSQIIKDQEGVNRLNNIDLI